jgi:hypothetical protein
MYAPVAPLGGGVMVMLCSRRPFSGYLLLGLLWRGRSSEGIFIKTIPQWGISWEVGAPASDMVKTQAAAWDVAGPHTNHPSNPSSGSLSHIDMYAFCGFSWHAVTPTSLKSLLRWTSREWVNCGDVWDMYWIYEYVLDMF